MVVVKGRGRDRGEKGRREGLEERRRGRERGKEKGEDIIHKLLPSLLLPLYVSGSSKNPNINDIHSITCQLRWVWPTPTG